MRLNLKLFLGVVLGIILLSAPASALTVLKGDEAKSHLGDAKAHLLAGNYAYAVLNRSHRDSMHGRFTDGIVFIPAQGHILFIKNKDGERKFVVPAAEGREKDPVTEEAWRQKIENIISDDNPIPHVFLDDAKNELAIVFVGKGTQLKPSADDKGRLQIELDVDGARNQGTNRRRSY